jgi:hypothetical protein
MMPGMDVAPLIFGTAFAAFCVWLGVRIVNRRERWAQRLAWGLTAISAIYALGSGPTRTVALRHRLTPVRGPFAIQIGTVLGPHRPGELQIFQGEVVPTIPVIDYGKWWPMVYRPLVWASEQSWGAPIKWYWEQFPIRWADSK